MTFKVCDQTTFKVCDKDSLCDATDYKRFGVSSVFPRHNRPRKECFMYLLFGIRVGFKCHESSQDDIRGWGGRLSEVHTPVITEVLTYC